MTAPYQPPAAAPGTPHPSSAPVIVREGYSSYPAGQVPPAPAPPPAAPAPGTPAAPAAPAAAPAGGFNLDAIMPDSPDVPQELRGRRVRDAMRYYGIMRTDFLARNQPGGAGGQPAPAAAPGAPAAAAPGGNGAPPVPSAGAPRVPVPGQPGAPAAPGVAPDINAIVAEAVRQAMAPYINATSGAAGTVVYDTVKREFADWQTYDAEIQEMIQTGLQRGGDPAMLANPETWRSAYYYIKGRAASRPATPGQPAPQPAQGAGGSSVQSAPAPAATSGQPFFSEHPSAPSTTGQPAAAGRGMTPQTMTPEQRSYAAKFNISEQDYCDWFNGVPPVQRS